MISLITMLEAARARAIGDGLPVRRKDITLYQLLAECLAITEEVERFGRHDELREAVRVSVDKRNPDNWGAGRAAGNAGKGRRFAFKNSDVHILVSRFVLEGRDTRNSIYRYATVMREAQQRQIGSHMLVDWLKDNGGIKTLHRAGGATVFAQACERIFDMLKGGDGEAFFQAERFLKEHRPDLYNKIGVK